ncbi:unnamed protein product [Amoebophrya sp. A25]|nr:unnamed protein product [Amoebophrya sp. A25]|eukprot:GSA25T00013221001.1
MLGSPGKIAKARYQDAFDSDIFAGPAPQYEKQMPPGYRRDQMTSELFGDEVFYKDLRKQEGTFEPKVDPFSPRRKKLHFLQGGSVPATNNQDLGSLPTSGHNRATVAFVDGTSYVDKESHPVVRRHQELESHIFETTASVNPEDTMRQWDSSRITPHSFSWFNSEPANKQTERKSVASPVSGSEAEKKHYERAYAEKSSHLFDHHAPEPPTEDQRRQTFSDNMHAHADEVSKRKANQYYSDLFGRQTPMDSHLSGYFPKPVSSPESRIAVHGAWTDARTNTLRRDGDPDRPLTAKDQKFREFYTTEVPEGEKKAYAPQVLSEPLSTDTSGKVRRAGDHDLVAQVHQNHLKSSLLRDTFYERAEQQRAWEVAEVNISRVAPFEDEKSVKEKCKGFGCHVVKVCLDVDPISNRCKGRAKLVLRYNPDENDLNGLVSKIQQVGWVVSFLNDEER